MRIRGTRRWARVIPLLLVGLILLAGLIGVERGSQSRFAPVARADARLDLLGWIPSTDQSRRAYAVWVETPDSPYNGREAVDRLALSPVPLGLGRSADWQRTTGISASKVTGWATAPGASVEIVDGDISGADIATRLDQAGYRRATHRSVPIWLAPDPLASDYIVEGDNLRALNAIAIYQQRIILGYDVHAVRSALDAAAGKGDSLATEAMTAAVNSTPDISGFMVVDQRDLAIDCGVGRGWRSSDFTGASGRWLSVVYRRDPVTHAPVTSVWMEYANQERAEAGLILLQQDWTSGFVNQIGMGGEISDLAGVRSVYRSDRYVVADLVDGRDNGWVRSGVRFLIAICERASTLVPPGDPPRATPVASPSPMESP